MSDDLTPDPLGELGARIDKAYGARRPVSGAGQQAGGDQGQALSLGLRIGLELIVAVAVGGGIGYLLDRWLGTRPWGMIGCFFLGVAAGLVNVYRTIAGLGMAAGYRQTGAGKASPPVDEWDEG